MGHFRADLDVALVLDAAIGAVYLRLLFGQTMEQTWVKQLVDTLLKSCYDTAARLGRPLK